MEGSNLFCPGDQESFNIRVGGYDLISQFVNEKRAKRGKTIFTHSGDLMVGTRYFREFLGRSDIEFMNKAELDVMVLGNHEFDKGAHFLENLLESAKFPVLAANIEINDMPKLREMVKPYIITGSWPWRNGIIGVITNDTQRVSSPGENIKFLDINETVEKYIAELRKKGVNRIFILSHLGFNEEVKLAKEVAGIDVIIGGHSHTILGNTNLGCLPSLGDYPYLVKGPYGRDVLVVQAWDHSRAIGQLDLKFDFRGNVKSWRGMINFLVREGTDIPTGNKMSETARFKVVRPDKDLVEMVSSYREIVSKEYEKIVGKIGENLIHRWEKGSDIAPLVAKAIYRKLKVEGFEIDVVLQNAGGVRRSLEAGDISFGDINDTLPFFNDIIILKIKGRDLKKSVNKSLEYISKGEQLGSFPYLYGMKYDIENFRAFNFRVLKDGEYKPVDTGAYYMLATDSYIAYGGNGYDIIGDITERRNSGHIVSDLFADYIKEIKVISRLEYVHPAIIETDE